MSNPSTPGTSTALHSRSMRINRVSYSTQTNLESCARIRKAIGRPVSLHRPSSNMIALLLALCLPAFLPFAAVLARASTRSLKDLDGPIVPLAPAKLPVKGAWQLWYFDFVSASDDTSLQVAFYSGFPFGPLLGKDVPYYVQVSGTFSNGTPWDFYAPTTGLGQVSHSKSGPSYGTQGAWPGVGGWSASGNDDSPSWLVTFDTGPGGVAGNLTLNQVAPPHYPCDR